jgi:integral membrane protein
VTTQPDPTTAGTAPGAAPSAATATWVRKATGSLRRYRVMAWVTGAMLLLLCVEMVLKYVLQVPGFTVEGDPRSEAARIIAMVHGWVYVVYLVTVFDLWSTLRWRLGRLVTMALAGVVPVMSFVLERRVHAQARARIDQAAGAAPAA